MLVVILFALLGSSRGEYFVPQGVFGYYVGGSYQGPDMAAKRESLQTDASSDVITTKELLPTDSSLDVTTTTEIDLPIRFGGKFERTG